jgi:peptidoglycan/LPS O-acetylase OafA/YrhL
LSFILKPLYLEGWRAVDLFFCLSGFIFYWLYSKKIVSGATSFNEFFVLRFSRLYPLHFVTLMVAAAGQFLMLGCFGSFFVYPNNDLYHFLLQLVFASNWGFEQGNSFNGPVWSVSVEVFLYALFFVVCALRRNRWWQLVLLISAISCSASVFWI